MATIFTLLTSIIQLLRELLKIPRPASSVFLRRTDPQSIKQTYYRKEKARIDTKYKIGEGTKNSADNTEATPFEKQNAKHLILNEAQRFEQQARRYWGRSSLRHRFKSAWLYVMAGYCYQQAGIPVNAAQQYHYAANAFRDVESFEQSITHYKKAADLLEADGEDRDLKVRSLMRALGVSRTAGDLHREVDLEREVAAILSPSPVAPGLCRAGGASGPTARAACLRTR